MYPAYNLTKVGNVTDIVMFTNNVNDYLMFGLLDNLILVGIWLLLFISYYSSTHNGPHSGLAASLTALIVSIIMRLFLFTTNDSVVMCLILFIAFGLFSIKDG